MGHRDVRPKRRSYKDASLSQFRSFCEVCRRGGYAAAARELMLTSPAVWEQMQALEYHYGMKLLERAGPGVRPTVHGKRLLELIRPLVAGLDSTREVLQQQDGAFPSNSSSSPISGCWSRRSAAPCGHSSAAIPRSG